VCALVNEDTLSHGEFSVSFLKAIRPDLVVVGKKTNGIVGNITNIVVPGGVVVGFTCMGLSRPDGESIQRRGIMPDILVKETVPAVVNGTDQILDAAVLHLQLKKKKPIVK
jgi:C-terminal processing protease CtpA/Prc